jgi:hypothetical protein
VAIHGDTNWQLFDPDIGNLRFTGSLKDCEAAARPGADLWLSALCL